jgi:hypothetical protein
MALAWFIISYVPGGQTGNATYLEYIFIRPYLLLLFTSYDVEISAKLERCLYYCQCCDNFIPEKGSDDKALLKLH